MKPLANKTSIIFGLMVLLYLGAFYFVSIKTREYPHEIHLDNLNEIAQKYTQKKTDDKLKNEATLKTNPNSNLDSNSNDNEESLEDQENTKQSNPNEHPEINDQNTESNKPTKTDQPTKKDPKLEKPNDHKNKNNFDTPAVDKALQNKPPIKPKPTKQTLPPAPSPKTKSTPTSSQPEDDSIPIFEVSGKRSKDILIGRPSEYFTMGFRPTEEFIKIKEQRDNNFEEIISKYSFVDHGLERMKKILASVVEPWGEPFVFQATDLIQSTPYQPTIIEKEPYPANIIALGEEVVPEVVHQEIKRVCDYLKSIKEEKLCRMFTKCYPNTLESTTFLLDDNSTFVITGDIDLMWLRDSSAQVHQYLPLSHDPQIQRIIEGLIKKQFYFIKRDPYGASFRTRLRAHSDDAINFFHIRKGRNMYVSMHNYELDSICYPVALSYHWWKSSGRKDIFTQEWKTSAMLIMSVMLTEQNHDRDSPYSYTELSRNGRGKQSSYTGMTWTGFRPSDDQCDFPFLVPSNMFASVILQYLEEIFQVVYNDEEQSLLAAKLHKDIVSGIQKHAIVKRNIGNRNADIYAYEVDGMGNFNTLDDANVPSLLSLGYLGFNNPLDPNMEIYKDTLRYILSPQNSFYNQGSHAKGVGSPHTPRKYIWPMAVTMEGLVSFDLKQIKSVLKTLEDTDAGTEYMHESFNPDSPGSFTRPWFAWANSLFSELVIKYVDMKQIEDEELKKN